MNDTGRVRLDHFSQSMLIAHFFVSSTIRFFFQNGVHVHARCDTVFLLKKSAVANSAAVLSIS